MTEKYEYVEGGEIEPGGDWIRSHYRAPADKVAALAAAVKDICPYLTSVTDTHSIDPEVIGSLQQLMDAGGWSSSSLYC